MNTSLSKNGTGVALASTLVVVYALCAITQLIVPESVGSHMWLSLFNSAQMGSVGMWVGGIVANVVMGYISGYIFACIYNKVKK